MSTTLRTQLLGPHREENTSDPRRRLQRRLRPLLFRIITVFRGKFPVRSPECMLVLSKTPRAGAGLERKYACLPLEKLLDAFEMFVINRPGMISNDSHGRSMHSPLFYRGGFISQFHAGRSNRTSACPHLISQHQGRQGTDLSFNADSPTPLKSFTFYPGLLKPSAPPASHCNREAQSADGPRACKTPFPPPVSNIRAQPDQKARHRSATTPLAKRRESFPLPDAAAACDNRKPQISKDRAP